jgi:phenylacetate-coenzyme A ligase PaaK-like adenylate-forming protein
MELNEILALAPYSLNKEAKHKMLNERLRTLTRYHYEHCDAYKRIVKAEKIDINNLPEYDNIPPLPVRLFKDYELRSVGQDTVAKTLTSSGTTGQQVSKIYLDKTASANQTKTLTHIMSAWLGSKRLPMLILDTSAVIKNRTMFSARGAGIIGFSVYGSKRLYALDEEMKLNINGIQNFLEEHKGETIFMFGFTFMVWQYFYREFLKTGYKPDLSKAILVHGGGWKKLANEAVTPDEFKKSLHEVCGIVPENIHDYYGMVEQTGTIYMECECGHLHAPVYSDVLIRHSKDFSLAGKGERGYIEVVSVLPESYPGHILLTEDEGELLGEDDCPCGRLGKYFQVYGRMPGAEIRGCSDTFEVK